MRIARMFVMLGIIAAVTAISASAQPGCDPDLPPIGTKYTCYVNSNGTKVFVVNGGEEPANSEAHAEFEVVGYSENPCGVILDGGFFVSTSQTQSLGDVKTTLKPGGSTGAVLGSTGKRKGGETTYNLTISLDLQATAPALGGETFVANAPLVLTSGEFTSLPPRNVSLSQTSGEEIGFSRQEGGAPAFGLKNVRVTLNGEGE